MDLIRDISEVEELAKSKEDENWEFRSYLKRAPFSGRLDIAVQELYRRISSQIDCRQCANCCKVISPILQELDIQRLSSHLNLEPAVFRQRYLVFEEKEGGHYFREMPCPFLSDNLCSVYDHRPNDCRSYPHLHKKDFVFRLMTVVSNCSVCPMVFNVYEELKSRFWRKK